MARRWTKQEEDTYRAELIELYERQNKSIGQIAEMLELSDSTVFKRMQRLGIESVPERKEGYSNIKEIALPNERNERLAEFFGIMLGDGHISYFQTVVTLGTKELPYVEYVAALLEDLFKTPASVCVRRNGFRDVYIGSVLLTSWLREQGLVSNKVFAQVGAPAWIYEKDEYMRGFLRGFFDTDGSIYRLRFGVQISLTNKSLPLLCSLRRMLIELGYRPSEISAYRVYVTRRDRVRRFFEEIRPANTKHLRRFENLTRR